MSTKTQESQENNSMFEAAQVAQRSIAASKYWLADHPEVHT
jgi:hypothetical protein